MILLVLIALLCRPQDAGSSSSFRLHLARYHMIICTADPLQLKCEALPYRSVYVETRCYFAVFQEVKYTEASALCSSIFNGSKVAMDVSRMILNGMMLDKSKFHSGKDSKGIKQIICVQDTGYTCDQGEQSTVLPGKCFERADKGMTFEKADQYCSRIGMEVPLIDNDMDNKMFRALLLKQPAWIRNVYRGYRDGRDRRKWERQRSFSRFGVCDRPNPRIWAGNQIHTVCNWEMSSIVDNTGYWGSDCAYQKGKWDVICMKDAQNDFTTGRKRCIAHHEWDDETGKCEWTGPKDACLQAIDFENRTMFLTIPTFPKETGVQKIIVGTFFNDYIVKVIVRRGCMYTGYSGHDIGILQHTMGEKSNQLYGEHHVPCYHTGDLPDSRDGVSMIKCLCDPTTATLNDHIPAPPPRKKCIEHHIFNETTQTCEWIHDPKYCGELITYDGKRKMIEIQNWPTNRKYDVDHWNNLTIRAENFHVTITEVIVRQHCWATLAKWRIQDPDVTLPPTGYGKHQVKSHYNGQLGAVQDGTHRVSCECMPP